MLTRIFLIICISATMLAQNTATADNKAPAPAPATTSPSVDALKSAQALLYKGKYLEASKAFQAMVDQEPSSAEARSGLMRSMLYLGRFQEALSAGQKAVQALPSSALVRATFGDVNYRMGQMAEAEQAWEASLRLDPNSSRGLYGMYRLYSMLFMFKHAKEAVTKAHQISPSDPAILRAWINTLPRKERPEALKKFLDSSARGGDSDDELRDDNTMKELTAEAEKPLWVLAKPVEKAEIKIDLYGKNEVEDDRGGRMNGGKMIGQGFAVSIKINDRAGATLLLDTGASGITIGNKLAEKAGIVKIAESSYTGVGGGSTESYTGWADKIKIGDLEFHNCIVEVSSKSRVGEDSGLLGTDVFSKFLITLDFIERKIKLAPLPKNPESTGAEDEALDRYIAPEMQSFAKVYHFGHLLVVPAVLGTPTKNATGLFLLDTGAFANTISLDLARRLTKVNFEEGQIQGVSAKIKEIFSGDKIYLHFAGIHVRSDDITAFDHSSTSSGAELSGFIGIRTLVQMRMTIDYRDGLVKLEPYAVSSL